MNTEKVSARLPAPQCTVQANESSKAATRENGIYPDDCFSFIQPHC